MESPLLALAPPVTASDIPEPESLHDAPDVVEHAPSEDPIPGLGARQPLHLTRFAAWAGFAFCCAGLVLWGQPLSLAGVCLALAGMSATGMAAPAGPDRAGVMAWLPAGLVTVIAWALLWGLGAGSMGFSAWSSRSAALVGLAVFGSLTGLVCVRRGGRVRAVGGDWLALLAVSALGGFWTWVIVSQPFAVWSRVNGSGTDFLRHLAAVIVVREEGALHHASSAYPQALHALGAWSSSLIGLRMEADALWRGVAPLGMLLLTLMLLAIMSIASALTGGMSRFAGAAPTAAALSGIVFVQTAWFSTFLAFGNIMNMIVAVCLLALMVAGLDHRSFGTTTGTVVCASALAVVANGWQLLLPVVGVAALPWIAQFLRRGRRRGADWLVWFLGFVLALHGVLGLRTQDNVALASTPTVSNLFRPDWWWWVAIALAVLAIALSFVRGMRTWAVMAAGTLLAAAGLVAALLLATGSNWDLMRYYPVKALWTSMVVVIPLAASGLCWVVAGAWGRASGWHSTAAAILKGGIVVILAVSAFGVVGRGAAFPPHLMTIEEGRSGLPNWPMALLDALGDAGITESEEEGAIVFGLVPSASLGALQTGYVGMVDYMAMESLRFVGVPGAVDAPVKPALFARDMTQVCRYLKDHPASLRITGPNRAAGPDWIMDSGCPEDIVAPSRWRSVTLDPVWLERSPWDDGRWSFPRFSEVQAPAIKG